LTTFVGALLELLVVGSLLDEFEDRNRQLGVRQRVGLRVHRLLALQRTQKKHRRSARDELDSTEMTEKSGEGSGDKRRPGLTIFARWEMFREEKAAAAGKVEESFSGAM
jgi:hypothetical protein